MGDYIRGKNAYTKWEVDSENIDLDYRADGKSDSLSGWCFGWKGTVLKVLVVLVALCVGLVIGYVVRKAIPHYIDRPMEHCVHEIPIYDFPENDSIMLESEIYGPHITHHVSILNFPPSGIDSNKNKLRYIKTTLEEYGIIAHFETYNVSLDYPANSNHLHNLVSLVTENGTAVLNCSVYGDVENLTFTILPFIAYSAMKNVTGPLVYANYGRREDFKKLLTWGVNITGSVVIMRLFSNFTGLMVANAEEFGAVGVLLYRDPADFKSESLKYPYGVALNESAVPRDQARVTFGDPLTPFLPSIDGMYRQRRNETLLPKIPVQPISFQDAEKLMRDLGGVEIKVPHKEWRGGLTISYNNFGPGHTNNRLVKLSVHNVNRVRSIYNVIGKIEGKYEPHRYVIIGSQHEDWTYGAVGACVGTGILLEVARGFAVLMKHGWIPGRTIIFAFWGVEQFGKIGSTEWAEEHATELSRRAVVYINLDNAIKGNYTLWAAGSPLLKQLVYDVTKTIASFDPTYSNSTLFDLWQDREKPTVHHLNPWKDFNSFLFVLGIPSLHLEFRPKEVNYALAGTAYDKFPVINTFIDPNWSVSETLAKIVAKITIRLATSAKLPLNCSDYAAMLRNEFEEFKNMYGTSVNLLYLEQAIEDFSKAADFFHANFTVGDRDALLAYHEYNDQLMTVERAFLLPPGIQSKSQHRHVIFSATTNDSLSSIVFANIIDALSVDKPVIGKVDFEVSKVIQAIRGATNVLNSALLSSKNIQIF